MNTKIGCILDEQNKANHADSIMGSLSDNIKQSRSKDFCMSGVAFFVVMAVYESAAGVHVLPNNLSSYSVPLSLPVGAVLPFLEGKALFACF